jgi:hypothetical protein
LANDFLVLFRRRHLDARGHSRKKPIIKSKKSTFGEDKRPVQIEFTGKEGLKIYDPVKRRRLTDEEVSGQKITSQFAISRYGRLKFTAKVALSAGYYIFGEWFRENVAHNEIRSLMEFNEKSEKENFKDFGLKGYDEFNSPSKQDAEQFALDKFFCETIEGSCTYFIPGPVNLGIVVGILGKHVATLNVPANTDNFPFNKLNDLGHAVLIEKGQTKRMSYRDLARKAYLHLPNAN